MADEIEMVKFRVSVDLNVERTYEVDNVEVELRKDLLDGDGKPTQAAVLDWIDAVGHDALGSYSEDVGELSFSVLG